MVAFCLYGHFVLIQSDGEFADALLVAAVKRIGQPEDGGELEDCHALLPGQYGKLVVVLRLAAAAVVVGDERHDGYVLFAEAEYFGILYDVVRVPLVVFKRDEHADIVQNGGHLQQHADFFAQAEFGQQAVEQFGADSAHIAGMVFVAVIFVQQVHGRGDNL